PAPATPQAPQVIKWPGGYMVMNGPEVIVRSTTPGGGSTNLITGSGNGVGNKSGVRGGTGGVTVVSGARNGIGNQLIVDPADLLIDLDALLAGTKPAAPAFAPVAPPAAAAPPSYKGKASPFWTKKMFSEA